MMDELAATDEELLGLILTGLGAMVLQALLIIFFYVIYRKRFNRQAKQLDFFQERLLDAEIIAQEAERDRIAHDLHDVVGSLLSATKMFVNRLNHNLPENQYLALKQETGEVIDQTISSVRQIIYDMVPLNLTRFGLVSAVEELCDTLNQPDQLEVVLTYESPIRFQVEKELAVFRIVQELCNNTLKHAKAQRITLNLSFQLDSLTLSYQDDGMGFDPNTLHQVSNPNQSLGLKSIRNRIGFLQATYELKSSPGKGFFLQIELPLDPISHQGSEDIGSERQMFL